MGVTENKNQAFYLLISSVFPAQCLAQTKYICVCWLASWLKLIKGGIGGLIVDISHITYLARTTGITGYPAQIFDFTDNDTETEIHEVVRKIILPGMDEGDIPAFGS